MKNKNIPARLAKMGWQNGVDSDESRTSFPEHYF